MPIACCCALLNKIKTYPVAFFSRKLTDSQIRTWPIREKEAYAIVSILKKYASLIGLNPVLILTDHKSLENWTTEVLEGLGGPTGRRARWHLLLSHFKLEIRYVKGENNPLADAMSRWAYPAGDGEDNCFHGTPQEEEKMARLIEQERAEEAEVGEIFGTEPQKFCFVSLDWKEKSENAESRKNVIHLEDPPKALDLFSGKGSWKDAFLRKGYTVVTHDWDRRFGADFQEDILKWKYWLDLTPGDFQVVSASVPCEHYSTARTTGPRRNLSRANKITKKVLEIIAFLKPPLWFIENPRHGLLSKQKFMKNLDFIDLDYCQFSDYGYKKPTRFWGPPCIRNLPNRTCHPPSCPNCEPKRHGGYRHRMWLSCSEYQPGREKKWRVPPKLIEYLLTCNDSHVQPVNTVPDRFTFARQRELESAETASRPAFPAGNPESSGAEHASSSRNPNSENVPPDPLLARPAELIEPPSETSESSSSRGGAAPPQSANDRELRPARPPRQAAGAPAPNSESGPSTSTPGNVFSKDWPVAYSMCPRFSGDWTKVSSGGADWPTGFQRHDDFLFFETKLCIPTLYLAEVIQEMHVVMGHASFQKLWIEILRRYALPDWSMAKILTRKIAQQCEICQANEHRHTNATFPIQPTPIPPIPMDNIALDVFYMKPVKYEGKKFDCMIVIVDRHSGWVTAFPETREGLTAKRVARQCLLHHWDLFGIPRVIVSDQGPQFASAFWNTMCAQMGVHNSFCQAGHHRANGRAEVAGKILKNFMRKLQTTRPEWNWVEILPLALKHMRNLPGESGRSPYQIILGRDPLIPGVPLPTPIESEDATDFMERLKTQDKEVARLMNETHDTEFKNFNRRLKPPSSLAPGDKVWVLRPRGLSADKLRSWWVGPCPIKSRQGEHSYLVEVKPGRVIPVHRSQMKEHVENEFSGDQLRLFHFSPEAEDFNTGPDEWEVEKILAHRTNKKGKLEFLVKWKDWPDKEWEPMSNFIHRYSKDWRDYVVAKKLRFNIIDYLG